MKHFKSTNDILDFAINAEQEAIDFYTKMQKLSSTNDMKEAYSEMIKEEISHKSKLLKLKEQGCVLSTEETKITDLRISDYLLTKIPNEHMDYDELLIIIMKKEKTAYKLYTDLANIADNNDLRKTFLFLAAEEANHKLKFELEYDSFVLKDN